jgi:hypothetical protein
MGLGLMEPTLPPLTLTGFTPVGLSGLSFGGMGGGRQLTLSCGLSGLSPTNRSTMPLSLITDTAP